MTSSVSPAELRKQHPEEKRRSDFQNHFWAYLVIRRLSFYVAPIFIHLGFSANQVTLLGGVILVLGLSMMMAVTSFSLIVLGAVLINFWYLFDFVDGVVARYNETNDEFGAFLDWLIGIVYHTTLPFAVAIVLYRTTTFELLTSVLMVPATLWFGLAAVDALTRLFRRSVVQKSRILSATSSDNNPAFNIKPKMIASSIVSFKAPLLFLSIIFSVLDLWLVFYAVFNVGVLVPTILLQIKQLSSK